MRVQKKNSNFKLFKSILSKKKLLLKKKRFYLRKKKFFYNIATKLNETFIFLLRIKVVKNNIFCYLINSKTKAVLVYASAGRFQINLSKKTMRFYARNVLWQFFKLCFKIIKANKKCKILLFSLISKSRLKKKLIRVIRSAFKKKLIVISSVKESKCFNGCRQRKRIRRKRRFFRVFKNVA